MAFHEIWLVPHSPVKTLRSCQIFNYSYKFSPVRYYRSCQILLQSCQVLLPNFYTYCHNERPLGSHVFRKVWSEGFNSYWQIMPYSLQVLSVLPGLILFNSAKYCFSPVKHCRTCQILPRFCFQTSIYLLPYWETPRSYVSREVWLLNHSSTMTGCNPAKYWPWSS